MTVQKVTPFLWFDTQAEEAMNYYVATFRNAKPGVVRRYGEGAPMPKGTVMTATFSLGGFTFVLLNGGPHYQLTPATSFLIDCDTQEEIDHLWERLSAGGRPMQCGWVTDRFGVTWQIVPTIFGQLTNDDDPKRAGRVFQAMMKMTKFNIQGLLDAAKG